MPPTGGNYWDSLSGSDGDRPAKIKRNRASSNSQAVGSNFPSLSFGKGSNDDRKYLLIKATNQDKPLRSYNPFMVDKLLRGIHSTFEASYNRDGNVILVVGNRNIADKFIKVKTIDKIGISCEYYGTLNHSQGVIYSRELIPLTDDEILEGLKLKCPDVVSIYRFKSVRKEATNREPQYNGAIVVTFDRLEPPEKIKVGFLNVEVRKHYPNPMRCSKCQRIGHRLKHCRAILPACAICAKELDSNHNTETCKPVCCINCSDKKKEANHPANDKNCPSFLMEKEIQKIRTDERVARWEAVKIFENRFAKSLALPPTPSPLTVSFSEAIKELPSTSSSHPVPRTISQAMAAHAAAASSPILPTPSPIPLTKINTDTNSTNLSTNTQTRPSTNKPILTNETNNTEKITNTNQDLANLGPSAALTIPAEIKNLPLPSLRRSGVKDITSTNKFRKNSKERMEVDPPSTSGKNV